VQANYDDVSSLQKVMEGCVGVFHLAAAIFGFNHSDFEKANVLHTQNVVKAVNQTPGITTFVHVSSLAASGFSADVKTPRTEAMTPAPVSDYGRTKLGGEEAVKTLRPSVKWTIIRPPIVYGKNDSGVSKIALWVKRGIMVNTSGNGMFSFVHVDDLVSALWQAYKRQDSNQETFFIAEPDVYSWDYFITEMARAMHCHKPFMPSAPRWLLNGAAFVYETVARLTGTQPALNYDKVTEATIPGHWICSSKKWTDLTGQKFTPLKEGLEKSFTK
ncbi:MAG: NAD-dependent epimerase/dehydratase family protein, partial [Elusimicrobiaceae bacterium]|nr:NAD-dependent epimerase/dehydratase family protein [Elusimicrobiaceae bacterium]